MVAENRQEREPGESSLILAAETLRKAAAKLPPSATPHHKGDEGIPVFWRIFGGTLISIFALVIITAYTQFSGSITDIRSEIARINESRGDLVKKHEVNELRGDVNRLNEGRGDLIKKDEFNGRVLEVWNGIRELQAANLMTTALKERFSLLEQQLKASEDERKELTRELQKLRERLAAVEGRQGNGSVVKTPPTNEN